MLKQVGKLPYDRKYYVNAIRDCDVTRSHRAKVSVGLPVLMEGKRSGGL